MSTRWLLGLSLPVLLAASLCEADSTATLENPQQGQAVAGIGVVSGWTFNDDDEEPEIFLRIDGVTQLDPDVDVPCCGVRADVQAAFPDAILETGFGFLFNFANLSPGPHLIGIDIRPPDEDDRLVIDHNVIVVRPGNTEFINSLSLSGATCAVDPANNVITINDAQIDSATADLQLQYGTSLQSFFISDTSDAPAVTSFVAHLNGSQEVPRVDSPATGEGTLTLNADNTVSCTVTTSEIADAVAAHIHLAPAGQNGDIIINLAGGPPTWSCPSPGTPLTDAQLAALRAGNLYFNVHSPEFPNGEIRGQIVAAPLP
ncbi:MAG: CHRD domain-containing protein [Thermodesulfobacteriota bacterium]|jgi:hypothetical protein